MELSATQSFSLDTPCDGCGVFIDVAQAALTDGRLVCPSCGRAPRRGWRPVHAAAAVIVALTVIGLAVVVL